MQCVVLVASSEEEIQDLAQVDGNAGKTYCLLINAEKTKALQQMKYLLRKFDIGNDRTVQVKGPKLLGSVLLETMQRAFQKLKPDYQWNHVSMFP